MHKNVFTLDGFVGAYIGYTDGSTWNGWAKPYFEIEEALLVMQGFNECAEHPMQYDDVYDQFYILDTETTDLEVWKGVNCITTEGIKHLYGIGAGSWTWDEEFSKPIAEFIVELFADYDYEVSKREIINKLKDFNTFKQAIIILRSDVDAEIKIKKMEAIL